MRLIQHNNAKTIVFISGMFAGGRMMWRKTMSHFPGGHQVLIHDPLCEMGDSVQVLTEHICDYLREYANPVTLVGNSLGSLVAINVAKSLPEQVENVLVSGSAGFGKINLNIRLSYHEADTFADTLAGMICFDKNNVTEEDRQHAADVFRHNMKSVVRLIRDSNLVMATDIIPDVKCPIRAIWGVNDKITPFDQARESFERFNIPVTLLDRCGHSPMYEKPRDFAAWVHESVG